MNSTLVCRFCEENFDGTGCTGLPVESCKSARPNHLCVVKNEHIVPSKYFGKVADLFVGNFSQLRFQHHHARSIARINRLARNEIRRQIVIKFRYVHSSKKDDRTCPRSGYVEYPGRSLLSGVLEAGEI